ncbi:gliding motility-associated C-terminal domain-containing protein [Maribacter sp.]|uniref:T9SS type B sorting domain-containing protein n=1 Tax=Maribacter sp. TaxID=1897614 RepID=UPI0025B92C58|nr:gliding motility-associated C-terminal domain-containing protein [Maribacter sp.]
MTTGLYTSDLLTINGCDSIINTTLEVEGQINEYRNYQGCQNDGYTETIGTTEYNETNTSGEERLLTTAGCDSVVVVDFVYESPSYYETDTSFCSEDEFYLFGKLVSGDTTISDVVVNAKGCDSTITYYVERIDFPDLEVETTVEIINNETYTFRNNIPSDLNVEWYPISGLSCADCPNPALTNIENISEYTLTVSDDGGCQIQYLINIEYTCDIYYPNIISLQDKDRGFQVLSSCRLNNFELSIYDRWGAPVFRSINQDEIWFGNRKNKAVEQGVYLYILKYIDPSNQTIVETGDITVVR